MRHPVRSGRRARSQPAPYPSLLLALVLVLILGLEAVAAPSVMRSGPRDRPWVALTFDDGWSLDRCERIVRTLRAKRAPATFFVNGAIINRDPDRWRKLLRGFSVANHTLSHKDLTSLDAAGIRGQIERNEQAIERILGRPMLRLLRPSYGAFDAEVLRIASALGYHTILWDTDSGDGRSGATTRSIIANGSRGGNGAVVLLHCGPEATVAAVGRIIDRYRARGYRLVDLGQLLDLAPPPTACRVTNERTGDTATSLQRATRRSEDGDRLTVQGTCLGHATIRKDLEIAGLRDDASGAPTLDGVGRGTVLTVKAGATVRLTELVIRAGTQGIENHGDLTLDGAVVEANRGAETGAGIHNADGATIVLAGASVVRRNTALVTGGGVHNAGALELRDASTIVRNTVLDEGRASDGPGDDAGVLDLGHPLLDGSPPVGSGGGLLDTGTLVGVVCAPELGANVRSNSPDDCVSLTSPIVVPPVLDGLPEAGSSEPPAPDEGPLGPAAAPGTEPPVPYRGP